MRGDQADVGGGAGPGGGARVHERSLDERAALSVEAALAWGWKLENKSNSGDVSLISTGTYLSADSYNVVVRDPRQGTEETELGRTRWQR